MNGLSSNEYVGERCTAIDQVQSSFEQSDDRTVRTMLSNCVDRYVDNEPASARSLWRLFIFAMSFSASAAS